MRSVVPAVSFCALAVVLSVARLVSAQTLMENSRIAFVTDRDGNDEIYLMRVDGSDLVNLTNSPSNDVDPAWSPDGEKIAFASDRDGDFDIYAMERDGTNVTQLVNRGGTDLHPTWAADGVRLMFQSDRGGTGPTIFTMNANGSSQTQISDTADGGYEPVWSPDISEMAYVRSGVGGGWHSIVGLEFRSSGNHYALTHREGARVERGSPAWSHGGWNLAWEESNGNERDIWRSEPGYFAAYGRMRATTGPDDDRDPSWAPSGESIAFRRNDDIWQVRLENGDTTRIVATDGVDRDPVWSPFFGLAPSLLVNTRIAFDTSTSGNGSGLHIANYDGTGDHWIVRHSDNAQWSPDGTQLVFATNYVPPLGGQLLNTDIWIIDADGSDPFPVTADPAFGPDDTAPTWSPDGLQIAFVSDRDGNPELYVVNADGTDLRRLTFTSDDEKGPAWSPDGTQIAFNRGRFEALYLLRVADGTITQIQEYGYGAPAWSPDGTRIAGWDGSTVVRGIRVVDVAWPHSFKLLARGNHAAWSPDGKQIAFLSGRDTDNGSRVYLMNADGSRPRRLGTGHVSHHSGPSWSPFLGPDAARISILYPADGTTLPFNTTSVTFDVDIDLHAGGWRWRSNAAFPTTGKAGGNLGDATRQATKSGLKPGRTYTINAALVDAAGRLLSPNGTDSVTFTVAPVPIVNITTPTAGHAFATGTREAQLTVAVKHHDAHWHWRVNKPFAESGLAGGNHVGADATATMTELRDGVTYTVHVALVDTDHTLLEPSIATSATFTTGDPSYVTETVLPQGLSLFALPLDAQRMAFGAHELDFTKREGGLTAFDLLSVGSTICVRMEQGSMQAVVGRDNEPLFGSDFAIEPARGYVVNMLEETVVTIEGPPFGARLSAPMQAPLDPGAWAFVVAGSVAGSLHVPTGTRLRVRSGERTVTAAITPSGGFITAFVDSRADASVVVPNEPLFVDALTPDGYPIGGVRPIRVTGGELRDAFKLVTLDLRPTRARLLPNYPNPFNPETWIPFELAQSGRVGLRIYDLSGSLVRSVDLGTREPGYYVTPTDAARWDGRNDAGETVGSGVYVSELRVGASRDVRRLLIGK